MYVRVYITLGEWMYHHVCLCTAGAQEYTRALTASDTPVNAAVGGAASGALLFASYGSRPVYGAALMAALGCSVDVMFRLLSSSAQSKRREEAEETPSFWEKIVRKTTDEEKEKFLENRRRRILREDVASSSGEGEGEDEGKSS